MSQRPAGAKTWYDCGQCGRKGWDPGAGICWDCGMTVRTYPPGGQAPAAPVELREAWLPRKADGEL